MFCYKDVKAQLLAERRKNEQLQAKLIKTNADLEYLAMMTDVELEEEENGDEQVQ